MASKLLDPSQLHLYTQMRALRNAWLRDIARLWVDDWEECSPALMLAMHAAVHEPVETNV